MAFSPSSTISPPQDPEKKIDPDLETKSDSELQSLPSQPPKAPFHAVADGGSRAWMTMLGSFLLVFCSSGYVNAFGVYEDYYVRIFLSNSSSSTISWIGSVQILFLGCLGIPGGYAMDRGHFRLVMFIGMTLLFVSLFLSSFAHEQAFWQIFLSQGVGLGIAVGIIYVPALGVLSHHFKTRRSIAMGIAGSGSSVGGLVYPIMLNHFFHGKVGFRWGVRISAFITLALLIIGNVLITTTLPPRKDGKTFTQQVVYWKTFFKDSAYILATASIFILYLGVYFPTFFLQLDAISHGVSQSTAFWAIAVLNGSGILGRIMPNFFVDRIGVFNLICPCAFACGALIISWIGLKDATSTMVIGALYGFFAGAVISLVAPMLALLTVDVTEIGGRLGVGIGIGAIGALVGPPICGALLTSQRHWWRPAVYASVCCFSCIVTLLLARLISARRAR